MHTHFDDERDVSLGARDGWISVWICGGGEPHAPELGPPDAAGRIPIFGRDETKPRLTQVDSTCKKRNRSHTHTHTKNNTTQDATVPVDGTDNTTQDTTVPVEAQMIHIA